MEETRPSCDGTRANILSGVMTHREELEARQREFAAQIKSKSDHISRMGGQEEYVADVAKATAALSELQKQHDGLELAFSGTLTNLGTDGLGLQLGLTAFETLRSPTEDGSKRVNGKPSIILVPDELGPNAEKIYLNENTGGGTPVSEVNVHAGKYKPVIVPWLSDPAFANSSATAWYLLRDPKLMAAVVVTFLNGNEQPTVESAEADFDTLGVDFRGYHDFGCDRSEYLSGVKIKGAV